MKGKIFDSAEIRRSALYFAGMEEFYSFCQLNNKFDKEHPPVDMIKEKDILDKCFMGLQIRAEREKTNWVEFLSLPTDYSYIQPYCYQKNEDLCSYILQSDPCEKWLIFVMSKDVGQELYVRLTEKMKTGVCFITAQNKESKENAPIYKQLVMESKFNCRVLIATTVIYNGVNIKDSAVKHIVLPFTTVPNLKQMIGRKRIEENENVNVYFQSPSYSEIYSRYINCMKDYMALIDIRRNLHVRSFLQLNGLAPSNAAKFYYLQSIQSGTKMNYLTFQPPYFQTVLFPQLYSFQPLLNFPMIYKLFFDTCYYIYLLQRFGKNQDRDSSMVHILLRHLGIASRTVEVIGPAKTVKTPADDSIAKLSAYLEELTASPLIAPDSNGSCDGFIKLKE